MAVGVPVLRVMAVFSLIGSIGVTIGDVYKAIERPDILAKLSIVELTLLFPALLYGAIERQASRLADEYRVLVSRAEKS